MIVRDAAFRSTRFRHSSRRSAYVIGCRQGGKPAQRGLIVPAVSYGLTNGKRELQVRGTGHSYFSPVGKAEAHDSHMLSYWAWSIGWEPQCNTSPSRRSLPASGASGAHPLPLCDRDHARPSELSIINIMRLLQQPLSSAMKFGAASISKKQQRTKPNNRTSFAAWHTA